MMRKSIVFYFMLLFSLMINGCCSNDYEGWNTISLDCCGTLKTPEGWMVYEKDGLIYIVDGNKKPMMIETHSYSGPGENEQGICETNDYYKNITNLRTVSSFALSNGAVYGEVLMKCGETQTYNYYLEIGYGRSVLMIFWDKTINEDMVKKIASSFIAA